MRRLTTTLCALALGVLALPANAWPPAWSLASCPAEAREKAADLARSLRGAHPGSANWLPHPYPQTAEEVFEDFAHQFTDTWGRRSSRDVPTQERHLLRLLKNPSRLRYEVIPVAEWRPERCGRIYGQTDRRLLLRLFERGPGLELGRFSLHESGQLGTLSFPGDPRFGLELRDGHRLEPLEVSSEAARRSSLEPEPGSLQYVALASPTIPCYDSVPCSVFRRGERIYLYRSGKLFELRHVEIQVAVSEFVHEGPERELATAALGAGDQLVTLGGDVMTVAVPLEPPPPSQ